MPASRKANPRAEKIAGVVSVLIAFGLGYWLAPFGSPLTSAIILGLIAAASFAARGLFREKN